jgi:hypothetical protein
VGLVIQGQENLPCTIPPRRRLRVRHVVEKEGKGREKLTGVDGVRGWDWGELTGGLTVVTVVTVVTILIILG